MTKVTTYSIWENAREYLFDSIDDANEFAREMKNQQYKVVIEKNIMIFSV